MRPFAALWLTRIGALRMPAEMGELSQYLGELGAKIDLWLEQKTYLPLVARQVQKLPTRGSRSGDPRVVTVHQAIRQIAGVSESGDFSNAQIAGINRRSRLIRDLLRMLLEADEPLILLGDPGTGKTMTLLNAARLMADSQRRRVFPRVIVYIRLGEFRFQHSPITDRDVFAYIERQAPEPIRPFLRSLDESYRLIVLFDGMDEMSRVRYNDHVKALTSFASARRNRTPTLFSCRITDFNEFFPHRRLVLMPFSRRQIERFLPMYIEQFPIRIGTENYSVAQLARLFHSGGLPMEPTNPFVLWLLCLHLQSEQSLPGSRVELLEFYNKENFQRKSETLAPGELKFPQASVFFEALACIAYFLMERNAGPSVAVADLIGREGWSQEQVTEFVRVGSRCGALVQSENEAGLLVRFDHHRLQEYFAARYIRGRRPAIDWLARLDEPRWQETMFNLALMGAAEEVIQTLTQAIHLSDDGKSTTLQSPIPEHLLADRVELASRLARQTVTAVELARTVLIPELLNSMLILARRGNPITQVKVIRACQNAPGIDTVTILDSPLRSNIRWVREQALVVLAATRGVLGESSQWVSEISRDVAAETLVLRLPPYCKAVKRAARPQWWYCLALAFLACAVNVALLGAEAYAILLGFEHFGADKFGWLASPVGVICAKGLFVASVVAGMYFAPAKLWAFVLGAVTGEGLLSFVGTELWHGHLAVLWVPVPILYLWGPLLFLGVALAWPCRALGVSVYLAGTTRLRRGSLSARSLFATLWSESFAEAVSAARSANGALFKRLGWISLGALCIALFAVTGPRVVPLLDHLASLMHLPFSPVVNEVTVCVAAVYVVLGVVAAFRRSAVILWLPGAVGLLYGSWIVAVSYIERFLTWLGNSFGAMLGRALVCLLIIILLTAVGVLSVAILRRLWLLMTRLEPPNTVDPAIWAQEFRDADSHEQAALLRGADPESLGVDLDDYLQLLTSLEPDLAPSEPALTAYWSQRARFAELKRHQSRGE